MRDLFIVGTALFGGIVDFGSVSFRDIVILHGLVTYYISALGDQLIHCCDVLYVLNSSVPVDNPHLPPALASIPSGHSLQIVPFTF